MSWLESAAWTVVDEVEVVEEVDGVSIINLTGIVSGSSLYLVAVISIVVLYTPASKPVMFTLNSLLPAVPALIDGFALSQVASNLNDQGSGIIFKV